MVAETKKTGAGTVMGVTGLSIWSGVLGEEYLTALKGTRKAKVFKEMQDDAVIACLLDAIMMPLMAAEFEAVPAGKAPRDKENSDFLKTCMDDMTKYTWRQHVLDMLTMLVWGWSVSEVVFKKRLGNEGDRPSKYNDGKIGLHILDPRGQETLYQWKMDGEFNVEAMVQQDPNSSQYIDIPAWKMLHATFRSRKRSPEGSSPMRTLYRAWYTRKNLEVIEAIGAERDLCGLPVIYLPYGATDTDKTNAETLIRNIRLDEEAGLVIPAPPTPEANSPGWKFELIGSPGSKQYDVRAIINDLNKIILMRFFAQFLMLGMQQVGTQALVEGSQDFFSLCLKSVQQELLEMWNMQLVPFLFSMNPQLLAGATGTPTLDWSEPGSKDVQKAVIAVTGLINAQLLTPEARLEDYFRTMMGLPDRPAGLGETPRSQPPAPGPLQGLMSYDWMEQADGSYIVKLKASANNRFFAGTSEGAIKGWETRRRGGRIPEPSVVQEWISDLTKNERQVFKKWQSDDYFELRYAQKTGDLKLAQQVSEFEAAIAKAPPYEGTVYRGLADLSPDNIDELRNAKTIKLDTHTSSTVDRLIAEDYMVGFEPGGAILFEIKQKSGKYIGQGTEGIDEGEVVLPKNTEYRVLSSETQRIGKTQEMFTKLILEEM